MNELKVRTIHHQYRNGMGPWLVVLAVITVMAIALLWMKDAWVSKEEKIYETICYSGGTPVYLGETLDLHIASNGVISFTDRATRERKIFKADCGITVVP